jgi:hypothetical protein
VADPRDAPLTPGSWLDQNRRSTIDTFKGTPIEKRILDMARAGKTAKEIEQATGVGADEVRILRDNAGIEPAGPLMTPGGSTIPRETPAPRPATERAPRYSVAKDTETGTYTTFRNDDVVGEGFKNEGEARKALNKTKISDALARRKSGEQILPMRRRTRQTERILMGEEVNQRVIDAATGAGGGRAPPKPPGDPAGPAAPATPPPSPAPEPNFIRKITNMFKEAFAPQTLSQIAKDADLHRRGAFGQAQRVYDQTENLLLRHQETLYAADDATKTNILHAAEGNAPGFKPTPEQNRLLTDHKIAMGLWEKLAKTFDRTKDMNFVGNFVAHMYKQADQQRAIDYFTGSGKFGSTGSLRKRTYDTLKEAEAKAGLKPLTNNLIETDLRYAQAMRNTLGTISWVERGLDSGLIKYYKGPKIVGATGTPEPQIKGGPPPEWVRLNLPERNGLQAYGPKDYATIVNRYFGKSLFEGNDILQTARKLNNVWTQQELSINGYHFITMANESVIGKMAEGLTDMLSRDLAGGLKRAVQAPLSPFKDAYRGFEIHKGWNDPYNTNPIMNMLAEAGARPVGRSHAYDYMFTGKPGESHRGSFVREWTADKIVPQLKRAWSEVKGDFQGAETTGQQANVLLNQAGRILQTMGSPLFDKYIPALKAGQLYSHMSQWLEKTGYDPSRLTPEQFKQGVEFARKAINSNDNRFGEMNAENLNLHPLFRDIMQTSMRSFSWAVGSAKEIGGGGYAFGKQLYRAGRHGENLFNITHKEHDPRAAYFMALPLVIGTISAINQYARTGEAPSSPWDFYAPKTGGKVAGFGGRGLVPERELMPGYQKDVVGWLFHPLQEAYGKLNGLLSQAIEQVRGKNFIGQPIYDHNGTALEQAQQRFAYLLNKVGPISVRNLIKGAEKDSRISGIERVIGFRSPGAFVQDPEGYARGMRAIDKREWDRKVKSDRRREGLLQYE